MKTILAAAIAAFAIATPAQAATTCRTTKDNIEICVNRQAGTYSMADTSQENLWIRGKCGRGGGAEWDGMPFPVAEEIHANYCPGRSLSPANAR